MHDTFISDWIVVKISKGLQGLTKVQFMYVPIFSSETELINFLSNFA